MKALILVGGYGTRMRPLTVTCPKSVLPFINLPMVQFQIQALAKIGVDEVILAINYQAEIIKNDLSLLQQKYKIKITYSKQPQALGTAGPLKFSQETLKNNNKDGLVFVFNSDIICDFPLQKLLKFHKNHGKQGSIVLAEVEDPSRFGVIVTNEQSKIQRFVEKPQKFISNKINAGIYLLNVSVLDRIPLKFCMIEREVFPKMAQENQLYAFPLQNKFWFDLGKPTDYLKGQDAYLKYHNIKAENCQGNCLVDPSAKIGSDCEIGPNVVIGQNCVIENGSRLKNCTVMKSTKIGKGCFIDNSIISWGCQIGNWVRIEGLSAISEDVKVKNEIRLTQCMILSHKSITDSAQKSIIM